MRLRERRWASVDKIRTLEGVRLFAGCSRDELAKIAGMFDEAFRPAGSVLVREGEPGNEFYVIVEGEASAVVRGEQVATLSAGDFFGEMSLLEVAPRAATITATTDMSLLVIDPRGFAGLLAAVPGVGVKMMRTMSQRLRTIETTAAAH